MEPLLAQSFYYVRYGFEISKKQQIGAPGRIRTCDPWLRRPVLYPLSHGRVELDYSPFAMTPPN